MGRIIGGTAQPVAGWCMVVQKQPRKKRKVDTHTNVQVWWQWWYRKQKRQGRGVANGR